MKIGVLALQGDFREHVRTLTDLGAAAREVRTPADLDEVEGLVVPGGESTTIAKLALSAGLIQPVRERIASGMPALGTCAGMITLASGVVDGEPLFASIDLTVRRNAYGRQVESFEADLRVEGIEHPVRGIFIRAPWVERVGAGVRVLAEHEDRPVVLEQGNLVVASFHPELVGETGLHAYWLEKV